MSKQSSSKSAPRRNQMGAVDGRSIDHDTLEQIRRRAAERVLDGGERVADVARALGFHPNVVSRWVSRARREGREALAARPISGRPSKLADGQIEIVRQVLLTMCPTWWGFDSVLWTRAMVAEVIERMFDIPISKESAGRIMRERMGLTPQRPVRRAYEADPERVREWLGERYPAIARRAKEKGATIYFADEGQVRSDYHSGTTWAPSGETPVVEATGQRFAVNLLSAISPGGELRWMEIDGRMTGEKFVEFLRRLIHRRRKPVFVIVDGHPTHRAKVVGEFVEANSDRLELHFLPGYSPQLNPDELVWNDLKHHTIGKRGFHVVRQLRRMVHEHLNWMSSAPRLIRSFFEEPHCRYAKA